ncbi:OmpA family protein [bacterium]|nr:OmpA family protein [bacterium]
MRNFWLFTLFISFGLQAQDSIFYDSLIVRSEGEYHKIKYKSPVTGAKQYFSLKEGVWKYYDEFDQLIKVESYKLIDRKKANVKDGHEIYLDPVDGDTILIRTYDKGALVSQYPYKEGILVHRTKVLEVYKDFGSFSVAEYSYAVPGRVDFVSLWKSSIEDPDNIMEMESYIAFEDSLGDPSLLQDPSFDTHHQFNYVSNSEFEIHPKAPYSVMSFTTQVKDWYPASESPDFYISSENAHSGNSFIGFRVFTMEKHIEYVQNRLKEPLKKDSIYCFSAYLKLSPGSKYATNNFGVMFTDKPQNIPIEDLHGIEPNIRLENQVLNFKTRWMKVQCTYKAKGGERWMVLGSFEDHTKLKLVEVPGQMHESYYYMDDVTLVPVKSESDCGCNFSDSRDNMEVDTAEEVNELLSQLNQLKEGDKLILNDIHFDNDKAVLLHQSFETLMSVLIFLNKNPETVVEISGHTSSTGTYDHNMELSNQRAEAVRQYLINNGISSARIIAKGYGPDQPIANNDTETGQRENRRVEFRIVSLL